MAARQIPIPKFKSEGEEADWWSTHPQVATRMLKQALKDGTVQHQPAETRVVTMRIPVQDIATAQELAESKGMQYQAYLKMLLHQALQRERAG